MLTVVQILDPRYVAHDSVKLAREHITSVTRLEAEPVPTTPQIIFSPK